MPHYQQISVTPKNYTASGKLLIYTKFWEYLQNKAYIPLSFHGDSIMSSLADSCVRRIIKSNISKTYFNSITTTLMVEMECDSKTMDFIIHLIWLPAQEDFIENKAWLRYSLRSENYTSKPCIAHKFARIMYKNKNNCKVN